MHLVSVEAYTIFRIFSMLYFVIRLPFLMGNCYISQISLSSNQPNSIGEITNFTSHNMGVPVLPLPRSVSLLCYCATWPNPNLSFKTQKSHNNINKLTNRGSGRSAIPSSASLFTLERALFSLYESRFLLDEAVWQWKCSQLCT